MEKDIMGEYGYSEKYFVTEKETIRPKTVVKEKIDTSNWIWKDRYFDGNGKELTEEQFYDDNYKS
jgi:hypothetical protein